MINGKFVLAVIPARGGSKGLPRKNILPLSGKPLIVWSIEAAKKSKYIDSCIVSTDDNVIAKVAESHGCEIPFIRPKHLARDKSATMDVILHALNFFSNKCHLLKYPTNKYYITEISNKLNWTILGLEFTGTIQNSIEFCNIRMILVGTPVIIK